MSIAFKKAERVKAKLKMAITGPSGSGKTMSALRLAKGIGGKVAVIDTENESASLYSDRFDFDTASLSPPYTTQKYLEALQGAIDAGYDTVVIDSITHQWAGEGGILSRKEQMDARGGNSFTNWGKMSPEQEKFKSAILHCPIHLIVTIRSKQEYVMQENEKGKQAPKKVGLAPVQREGMEYEFTTVFDVAMNHEAAVSKDRTGIFNDSYFMISEDTGKTVLKWLESGAEPEKKTPPKLVQPTIVKTEQPKEPVPTFDSEPTKKAPPVTRASLGAIINGERKRLNWTNEYLGEFIYANHQKAGEELTLEEMKCLVESMEGLES